MDTRRFRKRCKTMGCPNLHSNKNGYCDSCNERWRAAHPRSYKDDGRLSSQERGYDSRWHRFSKRFLADHPICAICGAPSECVDHKDIPADVMMSVYGRFVYEDEHYQALCRACNTRKGRYEDKAMRKAYERDKEWIERCVK